MDTTTVTPQTAVARSWCEVLGVDEARPADDFFALGGQSLAAMQLIAKVRRQLGFPLQVRVLLEHPVYADFLAQVVAAAR